jgi:hypothetical protein
MIYLHSFLPVAVRAWTTPAAHTRRRQRKARPTSSPPIHHILSADMETTIDSAKALLFGAFRYCRVDATSVTTVAEGLIYADDLPDTDPDGYAWLQAYAASHKADVDLTYVGVEPNWDLQLLSRSEFVEQWLYRVGYPRSKRADPATIVMFNAPFDLSRLAVGVSEARGDMYGGFSLILWADDDGDPAPWRPRLAIKSIDSKRALKKFRRLERGKYNPPGQILDLRTLVFALTGESHSLDSACRAFGVPGKADPPTFGVIDDEAIDYCRRDVAATTGLYAAAMVEYSKHPIDLPPTAAYSSASISKAYLRGMGIQPRLSHDAITAPILGYAMCAFYGGRAEVHIRNTPVPVALVDFTSMYPTVDILLGLWSLVTAEHVDVVDATDDVNRLLSTITLEDCYHREVWRDFVVIAELAPSGDVLPARAGYRSEDWSIGVNPLDTNGQTLWDTLPDLIDSKLLSGKTPQVQRAFRFVPSAEQQSGLTPVALRGDIDVDPRTQDFFRTVVEARQHLKVEASSDTNDTKNGGEADRLAAFLKVLANAGSYGIYAEMTRRDHPPDDKAPITVFGPGEPFSTRVNAPEDPGEYCYPPMAAVITGAARLMLTLVERNITDVGGTWSFCDTDSMAIVAGPARSLIPCRGGTHRLADGTPAIRALSYDEVDAIRHRFTSLNPYDQTAVPDLLKLEMTGNCLAISAKRYAIYEHTDQGEVRILKRSEHGLGHLLDPTSPDEDRLDDNGNRIWIDDAWRWIIAAHEDADTPMPDWADLPAMSRITVSSTAIHRPFVTYNDGRCWADQMKPFNFILAATIDPFGHPPEVDPTRLRLVAPFTPYPQQWRELPWSNLYDPEGREYRITTNRDAPVEADLVVVRSYRDILQDYRLHPEHKFNDTGGTTCRRSTRGLLERRPVHLTHPIHLIGKEANRLDDVRAGIVGCLGDVVTRYRCRDFSWLRDYVLPVLERYSGRELANLLDVDRRTIDRLRNRQLPATTYAEALIALASSEASKDLERMFSQVATSLSAEATITAWNKNCSREGT